MFAPESSKQGADLRLIFNLLVCLRCLQLSIRLPRQGRAAEPRGRLKYKERNVERRIA